MPIIKGAKKAHRVSLRKRKFNLARKDTFKKALKELRAADNVKIATELLPKVYQAIDKAAKRGVMKKNTAGRKKASAARFVLALGKK